MLAIGCQGPLPSIAANSRRLSLVSFSRSSALVHSAYGTFPANSHRLAAGFLCRAFWKYAFRHYVGAVLEQHQSWILRLVVQQADRVLPCARAHLRHVLCDRIARAAQVSSC